MGKVINKSEFISEISNISGLTKGDSGLALEGFTGAVIKFLSAGDSVSMVGFGSFYIKDRKERKGRNPQTGEEITVKAAKLPAFKAGKSLKDSVS